MSETDFEETRSFLTKFVSLLTDGQSRQLGYAIDSQYYRLDDSFADYVREGLNRVTLEDVNRVIRDHLRPEDLHYIFVTRDAADLEQRLVNDAPSPISYASEKPQALLDEDEQIAKLPLDLPPHAVRIVPAEKVFQ